MEVVLVLGMLGAFLFGAWVRKPFKIRSYKADLKVEEPIETEEQKQEEKIQEQFNNLMNYTGRTSENE